MKTNIFAFILAFSLAAATAQAQWTVNQGKPGPYGSWPVSLGTPSYPADGGAATSVPVVTTSPYQCSSVVQTTLLMDAGMQTMGVAATRAYTVVCNSRDNTSGNIRCRADADGGTVATTVGSAGDVLAVGDCIPYTNPPGKAIKCIGSGTYATVFECVP